MRENMGLYHGKRKDNGEWVEGYYACVAETHLILTGKLDITKGTIGAEAFEVIPETVGEFTSLPDKNGKKIFEGEIVNCIYDGELRTYIVVWDKDEFDFKATNGEEQYRNNFKYLSCCDEVEIIGNIYDTPELLEGGKYNG